jgi:hypothetical protein
VVLTADADSVDCVNQVNANFGESWNFEAVNISAADLEAVDWTLTSADWDADFVEAYLALMVSFASGTFWVDAAVCSNKWTTATGCNGIADPWAQNSASYPDGVKAAHHQYFRWLADAVKDRKAQFSVEKDDGVVMFISEVEGVYPLNNDGLNEVQAYDHSDGATVQYGFTSDREDGYLCGSASAAVNVAWFTVTGAYTLAAGATALAVATLF